MLGSEERNDHVDEAFNRLSGTWSPHGKQQRWKRRAVSPDLFPSTLLGNAQSAHDMMIGVNIIQHRRVSST